MKGKLFSTPGLMAIHLGLLIGVIDPSPLAAFTPEFTLESPAPRANGRFGRQVALNDRYLVVSETGAQASSGQNEAGSVHIFRARDRRFLRSLQAPLAQTSGRFGGRISLHGDLLLVGNEVSFAAAQVAVVFDLAKPKRPPVVLPPPTSMEDTGFGQAVLLIGNQAWVGAPFEDDGRGAVYVFDATTGDQLMRLTADDPSPWDEFGAALALDGGLLFVGAPGVQSDDGACYVFDWAGPMATFQQVLKWSPSPAGEGSRFGQVLAAGGNRLLIGEPERSSGAGAVSSYRLSDLGVDPRMDSATPNARYGWALAVSGTKALVGAPQGSGGAGELELFDLRSYDPELNSTGGISSQQGYAVALFENLALAGEPGAEVNGMANAGRVAGLNTVGLESTFNYAVSGQEATEGGRYARLGLPVTGHSNDIAFESSLSPQPASGVTRAVYADLGGLALRVAARRDPVAAAFESPSARVNAFSSLVMNRSGVPLLQASLSNAKSQSRQVLLGVASLAPQKVLLGGYGLPELGGSALSRIGPIYQSRTGFGMNESYAGFGFRLPRSVSTGVTRDNDSGFLVVSQTLSNGILPPVILALREGSAGPMMGDQMGQMNGPFAFSGNQLSCVAPVINSGSVRTAFLNVDATNGSIISSLSATSVPGGLANGSFRRMTGAGNATTTYSAVRATITGESALGARVTSRNNEGFWTAGNNLLIRKGDEVDGLPGVTIRRFLGMWLFNTSTELLVLAQVQGPGIKSSNSVGLWQKLSNGMMLPLIRQGDVLPLPDAPRVRRILRVDSVPNGSYYSVLVSLTGSSSRNQALLVGVSSSPNLDASRARRLPHLRLRKGMRMDTAAGINTVLRSMDMLQTTEKTGFGSTGGSRTVSNTGNTVMRVKWDRQDSIVAIRP